MLTVQENERLTRVGPGTPMGELMRRYWHPIAATAELDQEPVKSVRLLGEDLVLYRDRSGALGLIQRECAHRRVSMVYGIPEQKGLRCPYHGWLYDEAGRCLEQPAEPPDSTFKDRIRVKAYPVQELHGLVFAYLGPQPAPYLPKWDVFLWENTFRHIGIARIPCNWLQCMENSLDPVHTEWLHGHFYRYVAERRGLSAPWVPSLLPHHKKIGFSVFEHGVIKRRISEGETEESENWRVGHPIIFPHILRVNQGGGGVSFQFRVPVDDTNTYHVWYNAYSLPPSVPVQQDRIPYYDVPVFEQDGRLVVDNIDGQDMMVWVSEGPIMDRSQEKLAESDKGVILYRRLLREQIKVAQDGGDPMNVFRDPAKAARVELAQERVSFAGFARANTGSLYSNQAKYSVVAQELEALLVKGVEAERARAAADFRHV